MNSRLVLASTFCAAALALGGCASNPTNTQIGTGVGAVVGGVAGNAVLGGTLGMVLARQVRGPCALLRWSDEQQRYLCAAVSPPATGWASALRAALARRWIASGQGCDAELQAQPADAP